MSRTPARAAAVLEVIEDFQRVASRQAKVGHAQATMLCAIGVALSWTNAKNEDALGASRDESLARSAFFTASIMKIFGWLWALFFAQKALRNVDNDFGSWGPPIMMAWGAKSYGEHPGKHATVMKGFAMQIFWIWMPVWDLFFGEHPVGVTIGRYVVVLPVILFWVLRVDPAVRYFQELLGDPEQRSTVQICVAEKRQIPERILSSALTLLVLMGPVTVYTLESVFIFISGSTEPTAYILAVLDLVTVILALPFACSFVVRVVPQLWGGERAGSTAGCVRV